MLHFRLIYNKKRYPLTISRGTFEGSTNLYVGFESEGVTGWGEAAPSTSAGTDTAEAFREALEAFWQEGFARLSIHEIYQLGVEANLNPSALAALEIALWDHKAKKAGLPLHMLLGLPLPQVSTSVTIGINPPDVIAERVSDILGRFDHGVLKVKLGSPEGIEADKAMFEQVLEISRPRKPVRLRVDANGGWSVEEAIHMMKYLASHEVEYVEQPLAEGAEDGLPHIYTGRPLPIYVDESCRFSWQIPDFAAHVDGVNLKLMKCGGISEALRIIATARSFRLKTMIGCMGESGIAISAAASISGIIDHIDLDSHFNLDPDPAIGPKLVGGLVLPSGRPGHGAELIA